MADSKQVANLEETQKLDGTTAERLARILDVLQNIED
jgi:hypothetical protein